MSGVMMGSAVVGAGASLAGASKNARAATSAMRAQQQAQQADLAFRQQQYNRYLGLYGPIEEQLAAQAQSSQPLFYDQNKAQIQQQYANALRNQTRQMGMAGMAGSGLATGALRGAALGQASALSGAYSQGMQNRLNLQASLAGKNMPFVAGQGVSQGLQGMANLYGGQANLYNQAAAQGWGNFGQGMSGIAGLLGRMRTGTAAPPPTTETNINAPSELMSPLAQRMTNPYTDYLSLNPAIPPTLDTSQMSYPSMFNMPEYNMGNLGGGYGMGGLSQGWSGMGLGV